MVIFGATGDLTARKLMPALYSLLEQKILPERFFVVGFARRPFSHEEFRVLMREAVEKNLQRTLKEDIWQKLAPNLYYQQGLFEEERPYDELINLLSSFDKEIGACITRFFYLATPPHNYSTILTMLDKTKLSEGCGQGSNKWTRVLIEKPFGKDLATSRKLEEQLSKTFEERQIYRIDHYLAKETIQNILVFRFANSFFEPVWNKDYIDHVQITLAEKEGIANRGKFYDGVGALKDVAQNHLMAMLAYVTMEEPKSANVADIREQRVRVLSMIRPIDADQIKTMVVRGQYEGYNQEKNVEANSLTETYTAFKLFIDNSRWQGVPFYLRTGKKLKESNVRIDIIFKHPRGNLSSFFQQPKGIQANLLTIRVQPREGISLCFFAKKPGLSFTLTPAEMDFSYLRSFKKDIVDSYEKILLDSITGDQTLFATGAGFQATWRFINSIIEGWSKLKPPEFPNYKKNSWGPKEADTLIERDGRHWFLR